MKTPSKTKEQILDDIVNYIQAEEMNSVDAEHFYEEIHDAVFDYFNPDEE